MKVFKITVLAIAMILSGLSTTIAQDYWNSHTRLRYNYVLTDFNNEVDNNKLNGHLFRLQVDF